MSIIWDGLAAVLIDAINAAVEAFGVAATGVLSLLPPMPTLPGVPARMVAVLGWINWFFPVGTLVDIFTFLIAALVIWLAVRVVLAWGKVVGE